MGRLSLGEGGGLHPGQVSSESHDNGITITLGLGYFSIFMSFHRGYSRSLIQLPGGAVGIGGGRGCRHSTAVTSRFKCVVVHFKYVFGF